MNVVMLKNEKCPSMLKRDVTFMSHICHMLQRW
jgi:hypothetical protein